jgi:hypothetical protein
MALVADRTCWKKYELRPQVCTAHRGGGIAQNFNAPLVHFVHSCKAQRQAVCVKFAAWRAMGGVTHLPCLPFRAVIPCTRAGL